MQNHATRAMLAFMSSNDKRNYIAGTRVFRLLLFLYLNAAFRRNGPSIDEIHAVDTLLERTLERGVAEQRCLPLRHFSVIPNRNALNISFAELADKEA